MKWNKIKFYYHYFFTFLELAYNVLVVKETFDSLFSMFVILFPYTIYMYQKCILYIFTRDSTVFILISV